MAQVNRRGEKPVASPALEEALRRRNAENRRPNDSDRPPLSTLPGRKIEQVPGQLTFSGGASSD